jgi:type IV pilus assembly protein PilX
MHSKSSFRHPARQRGATLVVALVVLVLIMMVGIMAVSTSNNQFKLAGNLQFEDSALNNAETAVTAGENWLRPDSSAPNNRHFDDPGFSTYDRNATPQLLPMGRLEGLAAPNNNALTMTWVDATENTATANSVMVGGNPAQRYFIQLIGRNIAPPGGSLVLKTPNCTENAVNTYLITGRGTSARGASKYIQSLYSVLCDQ